MPLMSRKYPNEAAQAREVRERLGLNPGRLPRTHLDEKFIDGYAVKLLPATIVPGKPSHRGRRGMKHRVVARCPFCSSWIPVGRLAQHEPACSRKRLERLENQLQRYIAQGDA